MMSAKPQQQRVFTSLTNSWVRMRGGDLPEPQYGCTTIKLPFNKLLVISDLDNEGEETNSLFGLYYPYLKVILTLILHSSVSDIMYKPQ